MAHLPIVPDRFKLVVRDERSKKQMGRWAWSQSSCIATTSSRWSDACDAGREGELIFAYLYEKAKGDKPVRRLWLSSMTKKAMEDAFGALRPAGELRELWRPPRGHAARPTGSWG
jgi:DNA topoisomerase-3